MAENIPTRRQRDRAPTRPKPLELPTPPIHLSEEAAAKWNAIVSEWVLDTPALLILRGSLEMWDSYQGYRAVVAQEGGTFRAGSGQVKVHPAAKLALDSFAAFRAGMRQLGLEPEA